MSVRRTSGFRPRAARALAARRVGNIQYINKDEMHARIDGVSTLQDAAIPSPLVTHGVVPLTGVIGDNTLPNAFPGYTLYHDMYNKFHVYGHKLKVDWFFTGHIGFTIPAYVVVFMCPSWVYSRYLDGVAAGGSWTTTTLTDARHALERVPRSLIHLRELVLPPGSSGFTIPPVRMSGYVTVQRHVDETGTPGVIHSPVAEDGNYYGSIAPGTSVVTPPVTTLQLWVVGYLNVHPDAASFDWSGVGVKTEDSRYVLFTSPRTIA